MYRVYFASKLHHADRWRLLSATSRHVHAHARWLHHAMIGTKETEGREFWLQDEQDVRDADFVIVYAEPGEHLRGALVEAGMALAYGVPVIVVGEHEDYGTWQHHPAVVRAATLDEALQTIKGFTPRYRDMARRHG